MQFFPLLVCRYIFGGASRSVISPLSHFSFFHSFSFCSQWLLLRGLARVHIQYVFLLPFSFLCHTLHIFSSLVSPHRLPLSSFSSHRSLFRPLPNPLIATHFRQQHMEAHPIHWGTVAQVSSGEHCSGIYSFALTILPYSLSLRFRWRCQCRWYWRVTFNVIMSLSPAPLAFPPLQIDSLNSL